MKIGLWSTTAGNNNSTPPDGWPEGQAPSTVNDCAREMMAQIRVAFSDLQWLDQGYSPTFVNANNFTVPGNVTATLQVGRRLKLYSGAAGTIYREVAAASFTTVTTVSLDSGVAITASLSSFAVSILEPGHNPIADTVVLTLGGVVVPLGVFRGKNGNAATPAFIMDSVDTDTGFYWISDGILGFATNAVEGARLSQGGFVAAAFTVSDERLKCNWKDLPSDFIPRLAAVKSGTFDFIETGHPSVGVSAQSLRDLLPVATSEKADDGLLAVQYGPAALAACIELAKEVTALRTELNELKAAK